MTCHCSTQVVDAGAGAAPATAAPVRDPYKAHASAPAAPPVAIAAEQDPARRQELRRMHQLASAKVRVRLLGRRAALLRTSLGDARTTKGKWSPEKISRAEADLREVEAAISTARAQAQRLSKALSIR